MFFLLALMGKNVSEENIKIMDLEKQRVTKKNKHSSLQMSSMVTVRTWWRSIALIKHKQLIAYKGPNISCLYQTLLSTNDAGRLNWICLETDMFESENDHLKFIFSSTPSCAVPIKLHTSDFADLFISRSVANALMHVISWHWLKVARI